VHGSRNVYTYYDPAPKRPSAIPGTYGSGGTVSDLNNCDPGTAYTLGAGQVGGAGAFLAHSTLDNSYTAPIYSLGTGIVFGTGTFLARLRAGQAQLAARGPGRALDLYQRLSGEVEPHRRDDRPHSKSRASQPATGNRPGGAFSTFILFD
jgi:hypothetical protein